MAESTPLHPTNTKPGIKLEKTVLTATETVQKPDKSTTENNTERPKSSDFCYSTERNELKKENHNFFTRVNSLIANEAKVEVADKAGQTTLHIAALHGHTHLFKTLLASQVSGCLFLCMCTGEREREREREEERTFLFEE